jgi:hypothetical protein
MQALELEQVEQVITPLTVTGVQEATTERVQEAVPEHWMVRHQAQGLSVGVVYVL